MIVHLVLFHQREHLSEDTRTQLLADLRHAARTIPSIRRLRIGSRVKHGVPGYEQMVREDYAFVVLVEFDDANGLQAYLQHPAHQAIAAHFTISAQRAVAYDYDISEDWAAD